MHSSRKLQLEQAALIVRESITSDHFSEFALNLGLLDSAQIVQRELESHYGLLSV